MRGAFALLAIAILVPAALPTGSAQTTGQLMVTPEKVETHVDGPHGERLLPESGTAQAMFVFEVHAPPISVCAAPIRVDFAVARAPDWAIVTLAPASVVLQPSALGVTLTLGPERMGAAVTDATISFTREAPAFHTSTITIYAVATPVPSSGPCNVAPSPPAEVSTMIVADYVPGFSVHTAQAWHGDGHILPITLTNHANGQTKVTYAFGNARDEWRGQGRTITLNTRLESRDYVTQDFDLPCFEAPEDWDGRMRFEGRTVQAVEAFVDVHEVILPLDPTCPRAQETSAEPYEGVESLPGIAWLGALLALGVAAVRRRRA